MTWEESLRESGYIYEFTYGYWDWSWRQTNVYSRDGRVFALSDSGCSCNKYGDCWNDKFPAEGDLVEVPGVPSLSDLGGYSESSEAIQSDYRELFRRLSR